MKHNDLPFTPPKRPSSINLFLIVPIMVVISVGCFCGFSDDKDPCISTDSKNLIFSHLDEFLSVDLTTGRYSSVAKKVSTVRCAAGNEIVAVKQERSSDNEHEVRTVTWRNASKTFQLADSPFFEKLVGVIQDRYVVSVSRRYVMVSESSGTGHNERTKTFKRYLEPPVFTIEDSNGGAKKDYTFDSAQLQTKVDPNNLSYSYLNLGEDGKLLVISNIASGDGEPFLYTIDMFSGKIIGRMHRIARPPNASIWNVVADKTGKNVALFYDDREEKGVSRQIISVVNLETDKEILSRTFSGVSLVGGYPKLVFEENSGKFTIMVSGWKTGSPDEIYSAIVYDLKTGGEIVDIDLRELFKTPGLMKSNYPESVALLGSVGDELIFAYSFDKPFDIGREHHLAKINLTTRAFSWDAKLP